MKPKNFLIPALAVLASADVGAPKAGCFTEDGRSYEVLGVGGNFIVRPMEDCADVPNAWSIEVEHGERWRIKRDPASGAVEHRERLDGRYLVWPDGGLSNLDDMALPAGLKSARLMSPAWYRLTLDDGTHLALSKTGRWFLLPGAPR